MKRIADSESIASRHNGHAPSTSGRINGFVSDFSSPQGREQTASPAEPHDELPAAKCLTARDPAYRLSQVILPEAARREVDVLLSRIANHDLIYREWGLEEVDPVGRCVAINLYGLPGTGKTMLAEALAHELGRQIIDVMYEDLESKFVGETSKNIVQAFASARQPDGRSAILFFDEADSILGRRMTNVTQAADHAVNVSRATMLKQLDAFDGIVVFATNLARNFDGAFVRRILQHVEIPAPDAAGRRLLWKSKIPSRVPGKELLDWEALTTASEGLVGGEIRNAVVTALSQAASRKGVERRPTTDDFLASIRQCLAAKQHVGRSEDHS